MILICTDEININDEMLENVDTDIYGDKKADHVIWYRVKLIIDMFFKDENVAVQAQILRSLLTSNKLKKLQLYWVFENQRKIKKWRKMWYII